MSNDIPTAVLEFVYALENRLLDDEEGRAVARVVQAGVSDSFVQGVITDRVRRHRIAQAFAGPFEVPKLLRGRIVLARDQKGRLIRLPLRAFGGHTLVVGGSGSGKTVLARSLVLRIARHVKGVWLFDLRKKEFAMLRPLLSRRGVNLVVLPARALRLNPFQVPEHVEPTDWATRVADLLVIVLNLPPRAGKLIHATILLLYRDFGVLDGKTQYPTLFDLRERIAADTQANAQARDALIDSLDPLLLSIGPVLCWRRGWTTSALAQRRIVFEFAGLAEMDKNLILNTLILAEFTSRIAQGLSNVPMNLWICCDEAGRLVAPTNEAGGIADAIALIRGAGASLFLATQSAEVAPAVLSNTAFKIVGRCGSARDYDLLGAAMGLTPEQRRYLSLNLVPGLFAGQVGEGRWRRPFLFRVRPLRLSASRVTASTVGGSGVPLFGGGEIGDLDGLESLPVEPAIGFENWSPNGSGGSVTPTAEFTTNSTVSDAHISYLRAVAEHPGRPSSAFTKIVGISPKRAQAIRKQLIDDGFLREHAVATGARGRTAIVLEPLEPAYALLALQLNPLETGK